jgi:hypothetical protein
VFAHSLNPNLPIKLNAGSGFGSFEACIATHRMSQRLAATTTMVTMRYQIGNCGLTLGSPQLATRQASAEEPGSTRVPQG